jgi:hypothetical protein
MRVSIALQRRINFFVVSTESIQHPDPQFGQVTAGRSLPQVAPDLGAIGADASGFPQIAQSSLVGHELLMI